MSRWGTLDQVKLFEPSNREAREHPAKRAENLLTETATEVRNMNRSFCTTIVLTLTTILLSHAHADEQVPSSVRFSIVVQPEVIAQYRLPIIAKLKVPSSADQSRIHAKDHVQLSCTNFVAHILVGETRYVLQNPKDCQSLVRFEGIKACQTRVEFDETRRTVKIADGPGGQPISLGTCATPSENANAVNPQQKFLTPNPFERSSKSFQFRQ